MSYELRFKDESGADCFVKLGSNIELVVKSKVRNNRKQITELTERDNNALFMRYAEGAILKDIGTHFGVTQSRASQIVNNALAKIGLKTYLQGLDYGSKQE